MIHIFLSYRQADSGSATGRLGDNLRMKFGEGLVFHDVKDIKVGINWRKQITQVLRKADVVLAIIGPGWSATVDAKGRRRLDHAQDPVRTELELAIQLEIPIVPVLVGGATMPSLDEFPDSLKPLYNMNAAPLRDTDFDYDFERLFQAIQAYDRESESPSRPNDPADPLQRIKLAIWSLVGVGLAFVAWQSFVILILFVGVILIVLGVTDGKIGFIPKVSKGAQKWLRSWGITLALISIVLHFLSSFAGFVSPVSGGQAPQPPEKHVNIHLIRAPAHLAQVSVAASDAKPVATMTVVERHPTEAPKSFGTNVIVYIDTITLFGKSRFLICQTDVALGKGEMDYDAFKAALAGGKTKIFSERKVSKTEVIDFRWNERDYRAKVELKWFVSGKGFAVIDVYSR
jgi:hypothetical protein